MGIWRQPHRDVPRLRPGEDDQGLTPPILRQRQLGSGVSFGKPIPRGLVRWEEVRVGSGVLKVQEAFWDKLEGKLSATVELNPRI